jgi:signal peptidase I
MSGSGARDGFGSPPWDPADPVPHPDLDDTQALPGLGSIPGPSGPGSNAPGSNGSGWTGPGSNGPGWTGPGSNGPGSNGPGSNGSGWTGPGSNGPGWTGPGSNGPGWAGQGPNGPGAAGPGSNGPGSNGPGPGGFGGFGGPAAGPGGPVGDPRFGPNARFGAAAQRSARADETRVDLTAAVDGTGATDGADGAGGNRDAGKDGKDGKRRRSFWRELPVLVVVALVLALLIKSFVIQAFYIPSASMENTLEIGDRVLINKIVYHTRPIHRGDIIVFDGTGSWDVPTAPTNTNIVSKAVSELEGIVGISHDSSIYIKRVIGLPGDHVVCCNTAGQITVNGVALSESSYLYAGNAPSTQKFSITVPSGRLWVMGDHRAVSYDSRGHMGDPGGGTIPESGVLGRAFVIIWPPSRWGFLNIPATFEQPQLNASNAASGGSTAALAAAMDNGTPVQTAGSALPLGVGFLGAVPITLLQRTVRRRLKSRRARRNG